LPDVSNTQNILEYTKRLFKELFIIAKQRRSNNQKICVVLEEAHTVIPEWNFSGESSKASQNVLNSIAQIALQGRKYNVGLLVIAQRTANVSKTILTQCNSVVSFHEYDKTSIDFLSNYFGEEMAATLPSLKFRRAIAAGKAFKSNVPMIFEVPFIKESLIQEQKTEIDK
jgi:DNA helicase HerA-like ATPase